MALEKILDDFFKDYNIRIITSNNNSMTIEAELSDIKGLIPVSLRYNIVASQLDSVKFVLSVIWIPPKAFQTDSLFKFVNKTIWRYGSLGLPAIFRPGLKNFNSF